MVKIKLKKLEAGPDGVTQPGTVVDRDEDEAKMLVDTRQAEYVEEANKDLEQADAAGDGPEDEDETKEELQGSEPETAMQSPAEEQATAPVQKNRKKK